MAENKETRELGDKELQEVSGGIFGWLSSSEVDELPAGALLSWEPNGGEEVLVEYTGTYTDYYVYKNLVCKIISFANGQNELEGLFNTNIRHVLKVGDIVGCSRVDCYRR